MLSLPEEVQDHICRASFILTKNSDWHRTPPLVSSICFLLDRGVAACILIVYTVITGANIG
jgi:hypothetical protein